MTEREWQDQVLEIAQLYGWLRAHFRVARTERGWRTPVEGDGQGFPDLVLVKGRRLLFAELKSDTGRLSPQQQAWIDALRLTAAEVYVWRPRDADEVIRELSRKERAA